MNKEELIEVFQDTLKHCGDNIPDTKVMKYEVYNQDYYLYDEPAEIKVTNLDTLTAAQQYAELSKTDEDTFIGVLNFASATNPGGGVTKGSKAQEEDLCRRTNLYPALSQQKCFDKYYKVNREGSNIGSDDIIYSENVLVFKDKDYNLLDKGQQFYIDVITCAAPNLRDVPNNRYNPNANKEPLKLTDQELYDIHVKRGKHILEVALFRGISHLILGAFGCGAFRNNPEVVARAYRDLLKQKGLREYFKVIEFAIIGNNDNYDIFKRILLEEE